MHKFLTGLGAALLAISHPAMAGVPGWTVSESSGQVNVLKSGVSKIALRGAGLSPGDVVVTGVNGRAVLTRGEEFVVVSSGSRIQITDPARSGGFTQIIENFGNVIYKIKKMATPHFSVQTPYLAAVVKGTTFSVTVTDKGASVQVVEGKVQVDSLDGGASHLTLPGEIALIRADQPFRLDVQGGDAPRTIISPNAPTPGEAAKEAASNDTIVAKIDPAEAAPASSIMSGMVADNPNVTPVAGMMNTSFETGITAQISEGPVRLETVSQGLVSGDTSMPTGAEIPESSEPAVVVASVDTPPAPTPAATTEPAPPAPAAEVVAVAPAPAAEPAPPAPAVEVVSAPPAPAVEVVSPAPAVEVVSITPAPAAEPVPPPAVEVVSALPAPAAETVSPAPAVTQVAAAPPAPAPAVEVASLPAPTSTVATSGSNSGSDDSGGSGSNSGSNRGSNSGSNSGSSGNSGSSNNSGSGSNSGLSSNSGSSKNSGSGSNSGSSKNSGSGSNSGSSTSAPSGSLVITLGSKTLTLNASGASITNNTSGSPALSIASTQTKGNTTTVTTTTISKLTGVTTTTASMPTAVATPPAGN